MLSPSALAVLYDLHLAAVWGGHESPSMFGDWLQARWCPGGQVEPAQPADAVSVLGGAGTGIRWYTTGETVVGFVSGRPGGCYVVSRIDRPPEPASWELPGLAHPQTRPESVQ